MGPTRVALTYTCSTVLKRRLVPTTFLLETKSRPSRSLDMTMYRACLYFHYLFFHFFNCIKGAHREGDLAIYCLLRWYFRK